MFKPSFLLGAAIAWFLPSALAAPDTSMSRLVDPGLADKIDNACVEALVNHRRDEKLTAASRADAMKPIEVALKAGAINYSLEKHYAFEQTLEQRGKDDDKVLACRLTRPGANCTAFEDDGTGADESGSFAAIIDTRNTVSVLFGEDAPSGKIRETIIELIEAAAPSNVRTSEPLKDAVFYTRWSAKSCNGSNGAGLNCSSETPLFGSNKQFDERGSQELSERFEFESAFVSGFVLPDPIVEVICVGPTDDRFNDDTVTSDTLDALDELITTGASWTDNAQKLIPRLSPSPAKARSGSEKSEDEKENETEFTRAIKIVKDPSQFAASTPKGFNLGTDINLDGTTSDFTVDSAFGLSFHAQDPSAKCKSPRLTGNEDCQHDRTEGGSKRTYSIYGAYSQAPSTQKVFDTSQFVFPLDPAGTIPATPFDPANGSFVVEKTSFADGVLSAGVRIDYEYFPWFEPPGQRKSGRPRPGTRPLGSKSSLTFETLTDNEFDLQANRFEATWTPPVWLLSYADGFRTPISVFSPRTGAKFTWSVSTNIDGTTYARTPRIRDVTSALERRNIPDFVRVGANLEAGISGRFPSERMGRRARWNLDYKFMHRESLSGKVADVSGDEFTISFQDLWQTKGKFGLSYINEENAITLNERELFKLSVEFMID